MTEAVIDLMTVGSAFILLAYVGLARLGNERIQDYTIGVFFGYMMACSIFLLLNSDKIKEVFL